MAETLTGPGRTVGVRPSMFTSRDRIMREILDRAAARGETGCRRPAPATAASSPSSMSASALSV